MEPTIEDRLAAVELACALLISDLTGRAEAFGHANSDDAASRPQAKDGRHVAFRRIVDAAAAIRAGQEMG